MQILQNYYFNTLKTGNYLFYAPKLQTKNEKKSFHFRKTDETIILLSTHIVCASRTQHYWRFAPIINSFLGHRCV